MHSRTLLERVSWPPGYSVPPSACDRLLRRHVSRVTPAPPDLCSPHSRLPSQLRAAPPSTLRPDILVASSLDPSLLTPHLLSTRRSRGPTFRRAPGTSPTSTGPTCSKPPPVCSNGFLAALRSRSCSLKPTANPAGAESPLKHQMMSVRCSDPFGGSSSPSVKPKSLPKASSPAGPLAASLPSQSARAVWLVNRNSLLTPQAGSPRSRRWPSRVWWQPTSPFLDCCLLTVSRMVGGTRELSGALSSGH